MKTFTPKIQNIVKKSGTIPFDALFLFSDPDTNKLMIASSRTCENCDSQAYVNAGYVTGGNAGLHNFPFFLGKVGNLWCNDNGDDYCDNCNDPALDEYRTSTM